MDVELHDWEVLPNSAEDSTTTTTTTTSLPQIQNHNTSSYLEGIERDSEGVIRSDYFSLDSRNRYQVEDVTDGGSVESDNPSWIDPVIDTRYSTTTKEIGEFWSTDASSDDGNKYVVESEATNNELDIVETGSASVEMEKSSEIGSETRKYEESEASLGEEKMMNEGLLIETMKADDGEERNNPSRLAVVWWKLPLDLLKYCLFKASPVWTLSVAAAMMGVVILGRRLYKMKRKSTALQLKVTVDDKKVSQFMSRAARLNEAFSVVKRSPMIRPSLPAGGTGIAPWPMMALR